MSKNQSGQIGEIVFSKGCLTEFAKQNSSKDHIILALGWSHFGRFLGFSFFSKGSPLRNNVNNKLLK